MTVIVQDDHLTAGAWAAYGLHEVTVPKIARRINYVRLCN